MDLMTLRAVLTLDSKQYESEVKKSQSLASKLGSGLKDGLGTAAKVATAGVVAAGAAVVALAKNVVQAYAEYEQLVGGVETLFGDSAGVVEEYAANAYKTAGLSANEYMATVTSFSASLLQSLGGDTAKAADYADKAITDMSDNANKMGTDMSAIQTAYQGFAKQNYTMLDNLKLGYGGTKTEMERLVKDAEKLDSSFKAQRDSSGKLTLSYADIVDAIHIVQTQMGITGTTAEEASKTISGSVNAMKSAWKNLVVGLADDNADIDKLIDNFIESVTTAGDNIIPRVKKALTGITKLVTTGIQKLTPIIVEVITENMPEIIQAGVTLLVALITGLIQAIPQLVAAIPEILAALKNALIENGPALKEAGIQLLIFIAQGIASALESLGEVMQEVGQVIVEWMQKAWESIKESAASAWDAIKEFVAEAWANIQAAFAPAIDYFRGIWDAIQGVFSVVESVLGGFFQAAWNAVQSAFSSAVSYFRGIWEDIKGVYSAVESTLKGYFDDAWEAIKSGLSRWKGEFEKVWKEIKQVFSDARSKGEGIVNDILSGIKSAWGSLTGWVSSAWQRIKSIFTISDSDISLPSGSGHAGGLDFVPANNYPALLHRGEAVLTAREADEWRRGKASGGGNTIINQYIQSVPQTPVQLAAATAAYFEQARWSVA